MYTSEGNIVPLNYNFYEILGVDKSADLGTINRAYRKKAREHHPDKGGALGSEETIRIVNLAFKVLGNEKMRRNFDRYLNDGTSGVQLVDRVNAMIARIENEERQRTFTNQPSIYIVSIPGSRTKVQLKSEGRTVDVVIDFGASSLSVANKKRIVQELHDKLKDMKLLIKSGVGEDSASFEVPTHTEINADFLKDIAGIIQGTVGRSIQNILKPSHNEPPPGVFFEHKKSEPPKAQAFPGISTVQLNDSSKSGTIILNFSNRGIKPDEIDAVLKYVMVELAKKYNFDVAPINMLNAIENYEIREIKFNQGKSSELPPAETLQKNIEQWVKLGFIEYSDPEVSAGVGLRHPKN